MMRRMASILIAIWFLAAFAMIGYMALLAMVREAHAEDEECENLAPADVTLDYGVRAGEPDTQILGFCSAKFYQECPDGDPESPDCVTRSHEDGDLKRVVAFAGGLDLCREIPDSPCDVTDPGVWVELDLSSLYADGRLLWDQAYELEAYSRLADEERSVSAFGAFRFPGEPEPTPEPVYSPPFLLVPERDDDASGERARRRGRRR